MFDFNKNKIKDNIQIFSSKNELKLIVKPIKMKPITLSDVFLWKHRKNNNIKIFHFIDR